MSARLTDRDRAILRAVGMGVAELVAGADDLYVEGRHCSDQFAARRLAGAGLIAAARPAALGQRVRARLTVAGRAELAGARRAG
jgi:hypothetical protein